MLNNVVLMGRLCQTPELKSTQSGTEVTSFALAVERSYCKQGEERQADFIDCVAWRNTASFITRYFEKGSMIAITGEIQTRTYQDKNGNNRKVTEVLVNQASFCGGNKESGDKPNLNVAPPSETDYEEIGDDSDLPF